MYPTTSSCPLPWCLVLLSVLYWVSPVPAAERVALVIGNADYQGASLSPLMNPVHDARDMAQALRDLRFQVIEATNLNGRKMIEAVNDFGRRLKQAQVGLFYYSGHGAQYHGNNYLLPLHALIHIPSDLEQEAMDARRVLGHMQRSATQLNIIILDACRNNPFKNLLGFRGYGEQGLARMPGIRSSLIAYATQPDNVALDGTGRNSPYTKHLLRYLKQPGLTLPDLFNEVGRAVLRETNGKQEPWVSSSPLPRFCFAGCEPSAPAMPSPQVTTPPKPPSPGSPGTQAAVGSYPPAPEARLAQTFRNSIGMEFVLIPAGEFRMGSDDEKQYAPVYTARISRPFYLGKYEVTQAEWQQVMGNNPNWEITVDYVDDRRDFVGPRLPVTNVSWNDVQHFIQRLHAREAGHRYRLPTEAEWEWAARGHDGRRYPWGNQFDGTWLNWGDRDHAIWMVCGHRIWASRERCKNHNYYKLPSDGYIIMAPVGSFEGGKSPFGVYDMAGNVMEWVQDWFDAYPRGTVVDPSGPPTGDVRVARDCAWFWATAEDSCRSTQRHNYSPGYNGPDGEGQALGFRLLKEAP